MLNVINNVGTDVYLWDSNHFYIMYMLNEVITEYSI